MQKGEDNGKGGSGDTKGEGGSRQRQKTPEAKHAPKSPESPSLEDLASVKAEKKTPQNPPRQHQNQLILALQRCLHPVAKELKVANVNLAFLIKYSVRWLSWI